jgi:hypothetical protein
MLRKLFDHINDISRLATRVGISAELNVVLSDKTMNIHN